MIQKLLFYWYKFKSCASVFFSLHDLAEFFVKLWSIKEWMLIGAVLLWIPLLKITAILYIHFGVALPFGLPRRHSKLILRTVYWLTVVAAIFNLVSKYEHGYDHAKLLALAAGYTFMLVMDYTETEEMVKRIEETETK